MVGRTAQQVAVSMSSQAEHYVVLQEEILHMLGGEGYAAGGKKQNAICVSLKGKKGIGMYAVKAVLCIKHAQKYRWYGEYEEALFSWGRAGWYIKAGEGVQ